MLSLTTGLLSYVFVPAMSYITLSIAGCVLSVVCHLVGMKRTLTALFPLFPAAAGFLLGQVMLGYIDTGYHSVFLFGVSLVIVNMMLLSLVSLATKRDFGVFSKVLILAGVAILVGLVAHRIFDIESSQIAFFTLGALFISTALLCCSKKKIEQNSNQHPITYAFDMFASLIICPWLIAGFMISVALEILTFLLENFDVLDLISIAMDLYKIFSE